MLQGRAQRATGDQGARQFPRSWPMGSMRVERVPALPTATRYKHVTTWSCWKIFYCLQLDCYCCFLGSWSLVMPTYTPKLSFDWHIFAQGEHCTPFAHSKNFNWGGCFLPGKGCRDCVQVPATMAGFQPSCIDTASAETSTLEMKYCLIWISALAPKRVQVNNIYATASSEGCKDFQGLNLT